MLQYLAQGACQALEDADYLATQVAKHTITGEVGWDAALSVYNSTRARRTAQVQRTARSWGEATPVLQQVGQFVSSEFGLTQDGAERAGGKITISVDGHDHKASTARAPEVMVTSTHVRDLESNFLERLHHAPSADPGKTSQGSDTSSSTMLGSGPLRGRGMPSLAAASR
jgi:hypothetical protein